MNEPFACHRCGRATACKEFGCFCSVLCRALALGAIERAAGGKAKHEPEPPTPAPSAGFGAIYCVNVHFCSSPPSPRAAGDFDSWGHHVRLWEDRADEDDPNFAHDREMQWSRA